MKIKFSKRQVEIVCTYIAYVLLLLSLALWIFYQADRTFDWDILPSGAQQIIEEFIIPSIGGIVLITFVISILLNISLASVSIEKIAQGKSIDKEKSIEKEKTDFTITKGMIKGFLYLVLGILISLGGFKLWDYLQSKNRINGFIKEYANTDNLKIIESLLTKLNYQDSLQYEIIINNNYTTLRTKNDSILGLSNIGIHNKLQVEFQRINNTFIKKNDKRVYLNDKILINFNKSWVGINNNSSYLELYDNIEIVNLNLTDFIERIFTKMDDIEITENDGYKVYSRIHNSRSYEFVILSKSEPTAIFYFESHGYESK